jgi:peptide/nickel transport system substrate-binding protein
MTCPGGPRGRAASGSSPRGHVARSLAALALVAHGSDTLSIVARSLAALALVAAALAPAVEARAATLRIASAFDPQTMDPHSVALLYHTRVVSQVYEGLVGRDEHDELVPALATRWERVDATTWRFHLRAGVRFHDGTPFTADDAVFSLQRALAPPSERAYLLKGVQSVRKVDPLAVDVRLVEPDAVFPAKLVLIAMMSQPWAKAHGVLRAQDFDARQETYAARNANGTGRYRLERYEPDIRTVLQEYPRWWGRADPRNGNVDRAIFITIRSDATRVAALHSGEIDLVLDPPYQAVDGLRHDPGLAFTQVDGLFTSMLAFDQRPPAAPAASGAAAPRQPFQDVRVRQAVYQAINVDLIVEKVLRGQGTPAGSLFAPQMEGQLPALPARRRYDPVAARELLAQAGWPAGFDIELDCLNAPYRMRVCEAIATMLTQVGIRTRLRTWTGVQFFPRLTEGLIRFAEFAYATTPDAWQSLDGLLHTWDGRGAGAFNAGRYSSPQVDALIDQVRVESDTAQRSVLIGRALRLADEDVAYVPLYRIAVSWAMRRGVHVVPQPDDVPTLRWTRIDTR